MTSTNTLLAATLLAGASLPATAGEIAVEAHAGYFDMAAEDSASALFDSTGGPTFGGAVRYTFWRGAFASAGVRAFSREGERVFVATPNSPVQKLGFPLSMSLTAIPLQAGYRFRHGQRIVPYVSAGVSITSYKEESEVAGETFDTDSTNTGFVGAAGVEIGRGRFRLGAEIGYSSVPDAIGLGGVSKVYGDDNLGGLHAVGKLVVAFGGKPPSPKAPAGKPAAPPKPGDTSKPKP